MHYWFRMLPITHLYNVSCICMLWTSLQHTYCALTQTFLYRAPFLCVLHFLRTVYYWCYACACICIALYLTLLKHSSLHWWWARASPQEARMPLAQLAQLAQPSLHCTALLTSHIRHSNLNHCIFHPDLYVTTIAHCPVHINPNCKWWWWWGMWWWLWALMISVRGQW